MTDRYQVIRDALPILIAEAQAKGGRNERAALIVELLEERDALHAEANALRAENGRLQADRDRANQYANQQALECNKLSTELEAARGLLREAQSGKSPADVFTMVEAARKVITWLDWSGGLPCIGGESMAVDVKSLSFAVDEFDSEELLRKAAALTATPAPEVPALEFDRHGGEV